MASFYSDRFNWKFYFILVSSLLVSQVSLTSVHQQECVHDQIDRDIHIYETELKGKDISKRAIQGRQPIRIHPYYVPNKVNMSAANETYMKNTVMPNVLQYFAAALAVTPVTGNLSINPCLGTWNTGVNSGKCTATQSIGCGPNLNTDLIMESHYTTSDICPDGGTAATCQSYGGGGVADTDFIMYIYSQNTAPCLAGTLAYAAACVTDITTKRPIVGYVNFCPNTFTQGTQFQTLRYTAIHEFFHAFGFSSSLFGSFVRANGTTYQANSVIAVNGKNVNVISSPKVLEVARKYYNCSSIQGVELEDGGAAGSVGSHWEMRILRDELMTAAIVVGLADVVSISNFTLALMEDSGWYNVNYSSISKHQLLWGKDLGCKFVQGSCSNPTDYPYACTGQFTSGCTFDYFARGVCQSNIYMGNCSVYMPSLSSICSAIGSTSNCGNTYGANSKCAMGTLGQTGTNERAQCIEYRCYTNTTSMQTIVKVKAGNNQEITCSSMGQKLQFSGCNGYVTCPPAATACRRTLAENGGILPIVCPSACTSCASSTSCSTCQSGFYLSNSLCYSTCPTGTYSVAGNTTHCFGCNTAKCKNCRNQADYCIACNGGQVASLGACINSCPPGQTLQSTECKDDGSTIIRSYVVQFPGVENNLNANQANIITEFKKSLGLPDSSIKTITVSVDNTSNTTNINLSLQGGYTTITNATNTLIQKVNDQTLVVPINQNSVSPTSFTPGQTTVIPPTQGATTQTASSRVTPSSTLSGTSSVTSFWDKPFANLKVWQWVAIGGGSLAGIVLIAVICCCCCLQKEKKKKKGY